MTYANKEEGESAAALFKQGFLHPDLEVFKPEFCHTLFIELITAVKEDIRLKKFFHLVKIRTPELLPLSHQDKCIGKLTDIAINTL